MKYLSILGSTGSIGRQTLEVVSLFPDRFKVVALGAGQNIKLLKKQIEQFRPKYVCVLNEDCAKRLKEGLTSKNDVHILFGEEGYQQIASLNEISLVVAATVGISGLKPLLAAIQAGKTVALANKESLVTAGKLVKSALQTPYQLLPVDSEHSALFQLLQGKKRSEVKHLILTASGGPFWNKPNDFNDVSPQEAINHPRWSMGKKISVDSATLMNKGLEVIEAMWLFDMPLEKIKIVIHPQSLVHSLIELIDGSIMAHLSQPDMKLPIAYALNFPQRLKLPFKPLNLWHQSLEFYPPDFERFPCLKLALEAAKIGESMLVVLNAANEEAVNAFLTGHLRFGDIPKIIDAVMQRHTPHCVNFLEDVFYWDNWARKEALVQMEVLND